MKTSELIDITLDWAVAKCWGVEVEYINDGITRCLLKVAPFTGIYAPSTNWAQGGPIIEREIHNLFKWNQIEPGPELWCGVHNRRTLEGIYVLQMDGPTPLIAAMRCYVASKLGDEVEIPEELK